MPLSHEDANIMVEMVKNLYGVRFLSESDDQKDASLGAIIARCINAKGKKWIARSNNQSMNPAEIDMVKQTLEYLANRR